MNPPISVYQATLAGRKETYDAYIAAGKGTPFLYPWDTLPVVYLFLGLMFKHKLPPSLSVSAGPLAFIAILTHSLYICFNRRSLGLAGGYGIGLTLTWGCIISGAFLLIHDPRTDLARLELREAGAATTYTQTPDGVSHSIDKSSPNQLKNRQSKDFTQTFTPSTSKRGKFGPSYRLVWQPFPEDIWHRLDWTIDLVTSFRGPNWNFRITTMPTIKALPPPPGYKTTKAIEGTMLANEIRNPSEPNLPSLYRKSIIDFVMLYLLIDLAKTVMITDPYFLGLRPLSTPSPWPFLHDLPLLTRFLRLMISLSGVVIALGIIFSLEPLVFYTILPNIVPQSTLYKLTKSPLYDPRMYGPQFKSPFVTIPADGLAGFWGRTWHQMFRYGISEPSRPLISALGLHPRSQASRIVQLLVGFCLSGLIHTVAASTTFSIIPSRPLDPWLFFMSQALGVILQNWFGYFMTKTLKLQPPVWTKRLANTAFVVVWLWYTGPLLADDFARCGIWLFEPIPISFFRGVLGQGWWHWNGKWVGWYSGDSVFSSGIAAF